MSRPFINTHHEYYNTTSEDNEMYQALQSMGFTHEEIVLGMKYENIEDAVEYIVHKKESMEMAQKPAPETNPPPSPENPTDATESKFEIPTDDSDEPEIVAGNSGNPGAPGSAGGVANFSSSYDDDDELRIAMQQSMNENAKVTPHSQQRLSGVPVGLQTSSWNSNFLHPFFQACFALAPFRELFLALTPSSKLSTSQNEILLKEVQRLLALLAMSERKYVDPSRVLHILNNIDVYANRLAFSDSNGFTSLLIHQLRAALAEHQDELQREFKYRNPHLASEISSSSSNGIWNLFTGVLIQHYTRISNDVVTNSPEENIPFHQIQLEVFDQAELYRAFDHFTKQELIQNYANAYRTERTFKSRSLRSAPPVLVLQLQRIDKKHSQISHDSFEFPTMLYLDRYLVSNRERTMHKRKFISELKRKKRHYKDKLSRIKYWNNSEVALDLILYRTIEFLESTPPEYKNARHITQHMPQLKELYREILEKVQKYKAKIASLRDSIERAWDDMNQMPYRLHAVFITQGHQVFNSNHWAYVNFSKENQWYRFFDGQVDRATQDEVLRDGIGGMNSSQSAYGLIYVDHSNPEFQTSVDRFIPEHIKQQIPKGLITEIERDNTLLREEILSWDRRVKDLQADGSSAVEQINPIEQFRKEVEDATNLLITSYSSISYRLQSFPVYLLSLELIELVQFYYAQKFHLRIFHTPLRVETFKLINSDNMMMFNHISNQCRQHKTYYDLCVQVFRYLVAGMNFLHKNDYLNAVKSLFASYEKNKYINQESGSSRETEIVRYLNQSLPLLSKSYMTHLREGREENFLLEAVAVAIVATKLASKYPQIFTSMKSYWQECDLNNIREDVGMVRNIDHMYRHSNNAFSSTLPSPDIEKVPKVALCELYQQLKQILNG